MTALIRHAAIRHATARLLPWRPGLLAALLLAGAAAQAQTARKPSIYEEAARRAPPATAMQHRSGPALRGPAFRSSLDKLEDFEQLARTYGAGTELAQPHVLFAIDRQAHPARIYYMDTPRYQLHDRFLRARGLLKGDREALNRNYRDADRRFILGTLSWQPQITGYVYEFWEGDQLTPALLHTTARMVGASFFADTRFKANSNAQEAMARQAQLAVITQAELIGAQSYLPMNEGRAVGRLRVLDALDQADDLSPRDIVLLRQLPVNLPPVAGVISESPSTLLSHVNLLTRGWGVPNAYVRDAASQWAALDGQWVSYEVGGRAYALRAATREEIQAAGRPVATQRTQTPPQRLDFKHGEPAPLAQLRRADSRRCGAKAANLGEVMAMKLADAQVPDGFCIPFAAFVRFAREHDLSTRVATMQQQPGFATNARLRRQALAELQAEIEQWSLEPAQIRAWHQQWTRQLGAGGVFVRSSSSSEDLPHFSGAGLYTTVPNVRTARDLAGAVRKVWASLYNFEAWEARRAAGLAESQVVMGVLVQKAVDSEASGVLITRDPFDPQRPYATFIAAKRGLGMRVVDGQRVAEQVLYSSWSRAVQVISRSAEDTALQLDASGGLREVPATVGRAVLSDERVARLAGVGAEIEKRLGGAMDIEWALRGGQILVLQARPYVAAGSH